MRPASSSSDLSTDSPDTVELGPRAAERPADTGWTVVSTLDGRRPARVDGGGLVTPAGAAWSVDWWIGGDDRWYWPSREPAVRQRRLGPGPVVETLVRIPSGDARHRAYGVLVDGREATVIEVYNDSPIPVALAMAVRPYTVDPTETGSTGEGLPVAPRRLDAQFLLGERTALVLPRRPNQAGASTTEDLVATIEEGRDLAWSTDGVSTGAPSAPANCVALYPLPHRTSLRFVVFSPLAVDAGAPVEVDPRSVPDAEAVARGWTSVVDQGGRFDLPDSGLSDLVGAARARLVLEAPDLAGRLIQQADGSGAVLAALAAGGHRREVAQAIDGLAAGFPTELAGSSAAAAEILEALPLASAAAVAEPAPELLEVAVQLTHLVERSGEPGPARAARRGLSRLARLAGDDVGADHLAEQADAHRGSDDVDDSSLWPAATLDDVTAMAAEATPAGSWIGPPGDDPVAAARFVLAARSLMIDDTGPELVILPRFAPAWRGGEVEVNNAVTRHGVLSYAIRWHGYRPALLWQLDRLPATAEVVLRCPALDPAWSTTDDRGETLLAGTGERLPDPPVAGESFQ